MSCDCKKTKLQGTQYCQECMPDETSWLVPVDSVPDPFMMDRIHAYITPDNTVWVLSKDRTRAVSLTGSGNSFDDTELRNQIAELMRRADRDNQTLTISNGKLSISGGNEVTLPTASVPNLTLNGRNLSIAGGNSVRLPESKDYVTVVLNKANGDKAFSISDGSSSGRPQDGLVMAKEDFISTNGVAADQYKLRVTLNPARVKEIVGNTNQTLSLNGRTLSLSNGGSVELPAGAMPYDDTSLKQRVTALENKADHDTITSVVAGKDIQVAKNGNAYTVSTTAGDIARDAQTKVNVLTPRVIALEGKPNYTIVKEGNDLKLKQGTEVRGTVAFPTAPTYTLVREGQNVVLKEGNTVKGTITLPRDATPYDDTDIKRRLGVLEAKPDNDKQTLTVNGNNLSISGGNNVTLPIPNVATSWNNTNRTLTVGGTSVVIPDSNTTYTAGNGISIANGVITNTHNLGNYYTKAESDNKYQTKLRAGTNVTIASDGTISANPPAVNLSNYYNKGESDGKYATKAEVNSKISTTEANNKFQPKLKAGANITIAADGTISATDRDTDNQTLSISGNTLTIARGNSVTLPVHNVTISWDNGKRELNVNGTKVVIPDTNTTYTAGDRITITNNRISAANQTQTLAYNASNGQLSLSNGGNIVTIPAGKTYTAGSNVTINAQNQISVDLSQYYRKSEIDPKINNLQTQLNTLKGFTDKLLADLKASGLWQGNDYNGSIKPNNHIAYGTINLFGGTTDGNYYIRTNSGRTENDLAGGI